MGQGEKWAEGGGGEGQKVGEVWGRRWGRGGAEGGEGMAEDRGGVGQREGWGRGVYRDGLSGGAERGGVWQSGRAVGMVGQRVG